MASTMFKLNLVLTNTKSLKVRVSSSYRHGVIAGRYRWTYRSGQIYANSCIVSSHTTDQRNYIHRQCQHSGHRTAGPEVQDIHHPSRPCVVLGHRQEELGPLRRVLGPRRVECAGRGRWWINILKDKKNSLNKMIVIVAIILYLEGETC